MSTAFEWLRRTTEQAGDECILWPFHKRRNHPQVYMDKMTFSARQVALELIDEPQEDTRQVALDTCGSPACVNPHHLRWGWRSERVLTEPEDGWHAAVLIREEADEAREMYAAGGWTKRGLAREFYVSQRQMQRILAWEVWK